MKKLILVTGDIAAGKSTFAWTLASRYHIHAFDKDSLKEVLGDTVGYANREENYRLSVAATEILFHIFREFTGLGADLILEANFRDAEMLKIYQMAADFRYQTLTVALRGDPEVLYPRYMNRMNNENRHPAHLTTKMDVYEDFVEYWKNLRTARIQEPAVYVDVNDFSYQDDTSILEKIDEFMHS